ncbi:MAG: transporter substrate-binding domain-containing protein [Lachnoclostridium sp.]|nr:transporter substrate-binding domain-containing protein [Lachnospira sp.]MCM1248232.1 transporter substrate-binding domain-containing protein [Lachnoclostridium sp.]MCM1534980.1 transporter substrate-binding domain-containing protein [Clostridium sp.]
MKKNIGKKILALSLLTALAFGTLAGCGNSDSGQKASGVKKITVATTGSPAPYMVVDENNEIGGSDIEILKAIFERLPQYELEIIKADDPLTGLTSGLYDLAVNNYAWRDERGELYYYSLPYKTGYDVFIQRINDKPLTGLQDLADRGYKVEVSAGNNKALALEHWNEENPDHPINILYTESNFQIKFQNIVDGKTDVAIDDGPILDTLIGQFGLENDLVGNPIDARTQEFISPHNSTYFLFPKDDDGKALREDVDAVIKELKEDGTLAEILTKYFGTDTSPAVENLEAAPN